ncbi:MAG: hypothetical protein MI922_16730, partial [Bacteroidales bacterium]|nr:hypothetical protein [Bacteroidales bacterium]
MKRGLLRSILGLAVVFAMANVSFAQTHDGTAVTGYATTAYTNEGSVYVMEGKTIPVFAQPDSYYHPSWNAGTATWTLTDGFTWVWTVPAGLTASQNNAEDNYNEITADAGSAAGSPYTLSVVETAPAAYGSCAGAGTNLTINVVTQPAATLGGTPTYEGCEGDVGFPANINVTVSGGWQNYRLVWNLDIRTVDNLGA